MVGKHQRPATPGKKEAALPHPIPRQDHFIPPDVRHAAHARPLDVSRVILPPDLIRTQRQHRLRSVGRAAQLPREGAAVAHVCKMADVRCVGIKCVSDVAGRGAMTEQYMDNRVKCLVKLSAAVKELLG